MKEPLNAFYNIRVPRRTRKADVIRLSPGAKVSVHLEEGAEAVMAGVLSSCAVDVVLEQDAKLELLRMATASGEDAVLSLHVRQAKGSSLQSFFFTQGRSRDDVHVVLEGEGAEVSLNGLHSLAGDASAASCLYVDHVAPNAASDQLYKSVVRDKAYAVFNGRIMVRRQAQLTRAHQLNKSLLIGADARADAKPELEIFADDVKCSHGASVGQINEDEIFYLQTRGIDRARAMDMLMNGFVEDVVGRIGHEALRREVRELLARV